MTRASSFADDFTTARTTEADWAAANWNVRGPLWLTTGPSHLQIDSGGNAVDAYVTTRTPSYDLRDDTITLEWVSYPTGPGGHLFLEVYFVNGGQTARLSLVNGSSPGLRIPNEFRFEVTGYAGPGGSVVMHPAVQVVGGAYVVDTADHTVWTIGESLGVLTLDIGGDAAPYVVGPTGFDASAVRVSLGWRSTESVAGGDPYQGTIVRYNAPAPAVAGHQTARAWLLG